ncbi:sugar phosphate isomerase/epimerase [Arsenicicoccus piscis]|uniref:Sugar phosphate isomerase n=1 Tax=Arsenicicoccus piscis TaxID=673954 RepID=A0ABQ6HUH8_9MICO|nr:sugar phosphate isomerase/epimerase [Arsenicicoccus piscis]MCH8627452.1 sugar phosphate isomerase/epimerase [Arsenicicoccus piscis]GMA21617.1 sugar phosphate isomerase [Arsenicicoccus piscis]
MALQYGAYTACLSDRSIPQMLDTLKGLGLTSVEVNSGGFIPAPHLPVDSLLASEAARADYLALYEDRGMTLTALNCNGNPLSPNASDGPKHAHDVRTSIELAGLLGVKNVITMSGLPGADAAATLPTWVVNAWHGQDQEILAYQWPVAVRFWKEIDRVARDNDVRVALELHPRNLVFNTTTFQRLIEETGATNIGVEMDTSHLMWQQMDVPTVIRALGDRVYIAAAKDVALFDGVRTKGVLDVDFVPVPADAAGKVPVGYQHWCAQWPDDPAWRFVAVGVGHDVDYWVEVLTALQEVNPDCAINIEHEDAAMSTMEGLTLAAQTLLAAAARVDGTDG